MVNKRFVLSVIARIFDRLGFLMPFTLIVKCLFQRLWQLVLEWDDLIPDELSTQFLEWIEGLELIKSWNIPHRYSDLAWSSHSGDELHAFCDASLAGYGAVVYLRIPAGSSFVLLLLYRVAVFVV